MVALGLKPNHPPIVPGSNGPPYLGEILDHLGLRLPTDDDNVARWCGRRPYGLKQQRAARAPLPCTTADAGIGYPSLRYGSDCFLRCPDFLSVISFHSAWACFKYR